jgi:hypothetical protein
LATLQPGLACEFQRTEQRRHGNEHDATGRTKHEGPTLRGL